MLSTLGRMMGGRTEAEDGSEGGGNLGSNSSLANEASEALVQEFFGAIQEQDTDAVRRLLVDHKAELTRAKFKSKVGFPSEVERDAYTLLGAYLGPLTGLQLSILTGKDGIAKDILDSTFEQDVDTRFGNGNTALHLAVLLGAASIVSALIERGADISLKNKRGYSAVDMSDNPDILDLLQTEQEE